MSVVETESITKRKRNNEVEDTDDSIFDSVFHFFMDFANKAETIVPHPGPGELPESREEEEVVEVPLDMFEKLQAEDQEEVIKEVFGEIVWNLLGKLPNEGKEAFLAKCFKEFLQKLPRESQVEINAKINEKGTSTLIKEKPQPTTTRGISSCFPTGDLVEVGYRPDRIRVHRPTVDRGEDQTDGNGGPNRRRRRFA